MEVAQKLKYIGKGFIGFNPDKTEMQFIEKQGNDYLVLYEGFKLLIRNSDVTKF